MHDKLKKATTWVILKQPFFASLLMEMEIVEDNNIPTAATDGKRIYYNSDFVSGLTVRECVFLLCHEAMHPMGLYFERMGERDPKLWNIAHDHVINQILVDECIGDLPQIPGGKPCLDKDLHDRCDGSAEKIYEYLDRKAAGSGGHEKGDGCGVSSIDQPMKAAGSGGHEKGDGCGVSSIDQPMKAAGSPSEIGRDFAIRMVKAAAVARKQGKLPGSVQRIVEEIVSRKVDWREVLHDFVTPDHTDVRTWARPDRRMAASGVFAPSVTGERIDKIAIAVDASGSVSEEELAIFQAEINNILEDYSVESMYVMVFDTKVRAEYEISIDNPLAIKTCAGGGTSYVEVMKRVSELDVEGLVVLSDLCCDRYGTNPDVPVLWLTDNSEYDKPPFGSVTVF